MAVAYEENDWICGALCGGGYADHAFSGEPFFGLSADCAAFADRVRFFVVR